MFSVITQRRQAGWTRGLRAKRWSARRSVSVCIVSHSCLSCVCSVLNICSSKASPYCLACISDQYLILPCTFSLISKPFDHNPKAFSNSLWCFGHHSSSSCIQNDVLFCYKNMQADTFVAIFGQIFIIFYNKNSMFPWNISMLVQSINQQRAPKFNNLFLFRGTREYTAVFNFFSHVKSGRIHKRSSSTISDFVHGLSR